MRNNVTGSKLQRRWHFSHGIAEVNQALILFRAAVSSVLDGIKIFETRVKTV
jgi:hypothetical protein